MAFTLHSTLLNIPLQGLPVAAAALDRNAVIVAANDHFTRLCREGDSTTTGQRLADIVAKPYRPAVDEAVYGLEGRAARRCTLRALRAKPPSLWLTIDVTRLGPDSIVPYVACLHAISGRRRLDNLPHRRRRDRYPRSYAAGPRSVAAAVAPAIDPWPPFLTTLSHELRGPLTAILGWAQMAERGRLDADRLSQALRVITRNATSLSELIENLFDLSRRAAGSLVLERHVVDLNPLAHRVVESALPAARHRNVILTVRRGDTTLPVDGDPLRLEQIVRNLVDNAIKFTPTGGHVHVHTGSDGLFAELVVTDNGFGIPPDQLRTIFEPFRQDGAIVPASDRGLGLGLALVRELVQLHQGDVRALSQGRGHGSTFIIRLPLAKTAAAA
jgi:two-component sensor histidine kinase